MHHIPPLKGKQQLILGDLIMNEGNNIFALNFLVESAADFDNSFEEVYWTFHVLHQEGEFRELSKNISLVELSNLFYEIFLPHEVIDQLIMWNHHDVRKVVILQI